MTTAIASRRRGRLRLLMISGVVLAVAAAGWYGWRRWTAPSPPEVVLLDVDPVLVRAVEEARQQVGQEPYSAAAWGNLGKILRGADLYGPAAVCFAQAERLQPEEPRWPYLQGESLRMREPAAAVEHLRRAVAVWERQGGTPLIGRLQLAEALLDVGRFDEAEAQLARGLEADPNDAELWLARGQVAWARDDPQALKASRAYLQRCCKSPQTRRRACTLLAAVCRRLKDSTAAEDFRSQAAALPEDVGRVDPYVHECLQMVSGRQQRFRQIEALEKRHRFGEAIVLLRQLAAASPDAAIQTWLGRLLAQAGDLKGAEQALRQALEDAPESVQANYALSKVLLGREDFRGAAEAARRVLGQKPDHGLSHVLLGRALKALGPPGEAIAEFRRAVECSPDTSDCWLYLGEALAEAGQSAEARKCLEEAVRLAEPEDGRPAAALKKLSAGKGDGRRPG
jgi:tetratricopeptide (TPR) repeat protein